jgi:hypothetical protein
VVVLVVELEGDKLETDGSVIACAVVVKSAEALDAVVAFNLSAAEFCELLELLAIAVVE